MGYGRQMGESWILNREVLSRSGDLARGAPDNLQWWHYNYGLRLIIPNFGTSPPNSCEYLMLLRLRVRGATIARMPHTIFRIT